MEMDVDITKHSESVYSALCEIIGNEDVIELNRLYSKCVDLSCDWPSCMKREYLLTMRSFIHRYIGGLHKDILLREIENLSANSRFVFSGSRAEGFNFKSSDYDCMNVVKDVKVIQNPTEEIPSQSSLVLFAEKGQTTPGFVRMKVIHFRPSISFSLVMWMTALTNLDQDDYISSSRVLQGWTSFPLPIKTAGYNLHGPCVNTAYYGEEFDFAITLSAEMWPVEAVGCVHRLFKRRWPSNDVIQYMVSDGCLYVPIGCRTSPYADIEWRMSFSLAENRLVHCMNHSQFLTYGLLKLFLKEVVEVHCATKGLLCSYFMKTVVFWEIMDTNVQWTPSYLLQNVWNCFRRLLDWISNEYCPNFFIPENNMFFGKIHGRIRRTLLDFLSRHYRAGYLTFIEIPSIRNTIDRREALQRQNLSHLLRRSLVIEIVHSMIKGLDHDHLRAGVYGTVQFSQSTLIEEVKNIVQLYDLNISYFKILCCKISKVCNNKIRYLKERSFFRLINLSSPDCFRSKIFLALYLYRCKRYDGCVSLLHKAMKKIEDLRTIYPRMLFDSDKYSSLGGDDLSLSEGMYKFTFTDIPLDSETCIPEIWNEYIKYISPWVLSHLLLCLCNFWTGDLTQARIHLENIRDELQSTSQQNSITYPLLWHVLGTGQEIIGDFQDALLSYRECKRCMELSINTSFQDPLEVNKRRISRLMSLLRTPRVHGELISQPRHWRSRRRPPRTQ